MKAKKYNPELIPKVKEMLSKGLSITQVCAAIDISRDTFYSWKNNIDKAEFAEAVEEGLAKGEAIYEQRLMDIIAGQKCAQAQLTSLIYLMKCRYKERWNEHNKIEVTQPDKPISNLSDKEIDQQLQTLLALKLAKVEPKEDTVQ